MRRGSLGWLEEMFTEGGELEEMKRITHLVPEYTPGRHKGIP